MAEIVRIVACATVSTLAPGRAADELDRRELGAGVDGVAFGLGPGRPGGGELLYQGVPPLGGGSGHDRLGCLLPAAIVAGLDQSRASLCQVAFGRRELPLHQVG